MLSLILGILVAFSSTTLVALVSALAALALVLGLGLDLVLLLGETKLYFNKVVRIADLTLVFISLLIVRKSDSLLLY